MEEKLVESSSISLSEKIKNYFNKSNWVNWFSFFGFLIFSISIVFTIIGIVFYLQSGSAWMVFFGILDRFTNESNILLWVFMLFYIFFPKHSFMKNNKFLICTMVYIFFTFFGYNVILVGINGYSYSGTAYSITSNVWMHVLSPLYFIFFGLLVMYTQPNKNPKYLSTLLAGMIYPTIYVIYVITIPFVFHAPIKDGSQYSIEFWNDYETGVYTVYANATNVVVYPTAWAYIMIMWLVFFPGSFTIFYYCWIGFNKLNNSKNKK